MSRYLLNRLLALIPIWIGISFVAFVLSNLTPGDPARMMMQRQLDRQPTAEEVSAARDELRLDDAFIVRYVRWLRGAVTGDLGSSYRTGEPVTGALIDRFPATLQIATIGLALALMVAIPLGALSAVWRNSPIDHLARVLSLAGASMPSYWVAYLLILVFAVNLKMLPVSGRGDWRNMILPSVTLGLASLASLLRLTRAEMLEVLGQDYIRTGRAKGLREQALIVGHALRNALIPVVTVAGLRFGGLLGGAVIVETIFAWPGIGKFVLDSIFDRDYPVIQGFVVFMGTVFLLINLCVDMAYGFLDPRIRARGR